MPRTLPVLFPATARQLEALGERLRLARLRRQFSAATVAERAGITRSTLHRAEKGDAGVALGTYVSVLRVLGFTKEKVLGLVLGESFALSMIGGGLGLGLFVLLLPGFREGLVNSPMGAFAAGIRLFPEVLALGFGVTFAVGLLAGLVPAVRSAQRPITEGLRQVA